MDWVPFEDRARPDEHLARVTLSVDRLERIEISSDDEQAIGEIFAWLMGQQIAAARTQESKHG